MEKNRNLVKHACQNMVAMEMWKWIGLSYKVLYNLYSFIYFIYLYILPHTNNITKLINKRKKEKEECW